MLICGWSVGVLSQHSPRTVPFVTCPLNVNTHTKPQLSAVTNCGLCTSGLNDPLPLSQSCKPNSSMTLAAIIAPSNPCFLAENHHHRIAHLVFVQHFDELFVCLLNPAWIVAANGVDRTVCSPVVLALSTLNSVLASRRRMAKLKFLYSTVSILRPISIMVVTITPSFSL